MELMGLLPEGKVGRGRMGSHYRETECGAAQLIGCGLIPGSSERA